MQSTRWQLHLAEQQELPQGNQSNKSLYLHIIPTCLPFTNLIFCSGCCGLFALNDYRKKAGLSFSFLVFAALNITMVYNGANNLKKCPGEPMVPVYLLGISHFVCPQTRAFCAQISVQMFWHQNDCCICPTCCCYFNFDLTLAVAGSTSLALLVVRLIVSHVLMPQLVNHHSDISAKPGSPEDFPLVRFLVHGLKVFDTLASIFSTCWLIAGRYAHSLLFGKQEHCVKKVAVAIFCQESLVFFLVVSSVPDSLA